MDAVNEQNQSKAISTASGAGLTRGVNEVKEQKILGCFIFFRLDNLFVLCLAIKNITRQTVTSVHLRIPFNDWNHVVPSNYSSEVINSRKKQKKNLLTEAKAPVCVY